MKPIRSFNQVHMKIKKHCFFLLGIAFLMIGAITFFIENQPSPIYEQFLTIDYLISLLADDTTPEAIQDLGLDLIKRSDRVNERRTAISQKRRRQNVIVTEETCKVFSPEQGVMVDEVRGGFFGTY